MVRRVFAEKMKGYDVEAQGLFRDLRSNLGIKGLSGVRIINRYDITDITDDEYRASVNVIFSEPPVDHVYEDSILLADNEKAFAIEYLPGQYDQRADSASQCIQFLTLGVRPRCKAAKLIVLEGGIAEEELDRIKAYCINPVESHEALMEKPESLDVELVQPGDVSVMKGFCGRNTDEIAALQNELGMAMSAEDLEFCRQYFSDNEHRDPTITEIRMIDTYWSDHCRHTTFLTNINNVKFENGPYTGLIKDVYGQYTESRKFVYGDREKDICLMDIATIAMKELKKRGKLDDLDSSEEINACSIVVKADIDGKSEDWLVMFKNETHNHPTEIEPFGGAATCLGGAIRDPLSGRSYVYQAMRVTGSGDPRTKVADTLPGKLPQRKITTGAAAGYSSYGNQIGLATGQVTEIYDEGYVAKRMEIGAVIGAAPKRNVVRLKPEPGDVIILLGGRTGRDGCGGATGSSKEHDEKSLLTCGAEVQKGNPPTERKLQRLFRNEAVSRMIKRCNDFGAGGVSVAIGELAEGLDIDLDKVPKKYEGLDGTELAISESQERMAVVVAKEDEERFIAEAGVENLEAIQVAVVTDTGRLRMTWRGKVIVDLSREFLDTNGVKQNIDIEVKAPSEGENYFKKRAASAESPVSSASGDLNKTASRWLDELQKLELCGQKGLVERFDSTIGAGTVLMPFGGKYQLSPAEGMAAKLPLLAGETDTCTLMTHGFNPAIAKWSPFHGAIYAVVEAAAKIAAMGGDYRTARLTLQEYFEKPGREPSRWGKPFSALLGAYYAQMKLGIAAIGGKDSMSGTFKDLNVPPTLVAFAVAVSDAGRTLSTEFKRAGSQVVLLRLNRDENELPDFVQLDKIYTRVYELAKEGRIRAAATVREGGMAGAVSRMCFGNMTGMDIDATDLDVFAPDYGSIILELDAAEKLQELFDGLSFSVIGHTVQNPSITISKGTSRDNALSSDKHSTKQESVTLELGKMAESWMKPLESIFPTRTEAAGGSVVTYDFYKEEDSGSVKATALRNTARIQPVKPRVFIPVFPGTNCEYDSAKAFENAGGVADTFIVKNLTPESINETIQAMRQKISESQIIMFPGGFSAGDEPEGSGKFIATVFRNQYIKEAVMDMLQKRDGLILGICNGFQALVKLGLLPYGEIREIDPESPTLTFNSIGRHVSCMVRTRIASDKSPWFNNVKVGDVHTIAVSHGEGRFVAPEAAIKKLAANGQIATQYVDLEGSATYDIRYNPNGSMYAIEGITSPDGRVLGKMGHSERKGRNVCINVPGSKDQQLFEAGIRYFG
ncbi:MAG TPA: phosphoribosylformylglycinamidine synthase [Clostridia bacterium]|nr:phosphoribosylformylglycinamidine synthase [Clostridia bacterium]